MIKYQLSKKEFEEIYAKVPRIAVDLIIVENKKILLTRRSIPPFNGLWHIPGGGIRHREKVTDAILRVAREELGVSVKIEKLIGYEEVLFDGPKRHAVALEFKCKLVGNKKPRPIAQADKCSFFNKLPKEIIPEQRKFLKKNWARIFS